MEFAKKLEGRLVIGTEVKAGESERCVQTSRYEVGQKQSVQKISCDYGFGGEVVSMSVLFPAS